MIWIAGPLAATAVVAAVLGMVLARRVRTVSDGVDALGPERRTTANSVG